MINIDGSMGEGGGQVLRTSLALSMITGQPVRIENIRAKRPKPGLLRQHLTSVEAACAVCDGQAVGMSLGSSKIDFKPGPIKGGTYHFAIGTAGSTTLVLQTVLPALMIASEPSTLTITGGTHNPHAPSVCFLTHAFLPILQKMGPKVRVHLDRHGFYPAGGGKIRIDIEPVNRLIPIELVEAQPVVGSQAIATISGLDVSIATRELNTVAGMLGWSDDQLQIEQIQSSACAGNVLTLTVKRENITEVFTGFGSRGVSAERVASNAARDVEQYLASGVPVWEHLADQLMIPMALAGAGAYQTGSLSEHALTNAMVIEAFGHHKVHLKNEGNRSLITTSTT